MNTAAKIVAAMVMSWAILIWPGLLFVMAADYFSPSAAPGILGFALAFTAVAFWFHSRVNYQKPHERKPSR